MVLNDASPASCREPIHSVIRYHLVQLCVFWVLGCCTEGATTLEDYPNCMSNATSSIGDGYCDSFLNNNEACGWDGGDCCECTCVPNTEKALTCEADSFICRDPNSGCANPNLLQYINCTGYLADIGNGYCISDNNNEACGWDGGDCCECACTSSDYECGTTDFACVDPDSDCVDSRLVDYIVCDGDLKTFGNGVCDPANNNDVCGWDGGDCCECTCDGSECLYLDGNECIDPKAASEKDGCLETSPVILACLPQQQEWIVENTLQARALAESLNCSGGVFQVEWVGDIVVTETLVVLDKTVLNLTGVGSTRALIDGGGTTGLLTVFNASLYVSNITLVNGTSTSGGAIAALGSNVSLSQTSFIGNAASFDGGALFVGRESTLTCEEGTVFFNNSAGNRGGAVRASEKSNASWTGGASFTSNSAAFGGAIDISSTSSMSWTACNGSTFSNNMASKNGGGVHVSNGMVKWYGHSLFEGNTAGSRGGGLYVSHGEVTWEGESSIRGNTADSRGGGIYVSNGNVSWTGAVASFTANGANTFGGALYGDNRSNIFWTGKSLFSSNLGYFDGGAVYVAGVTSASWSGETTFFNNTASWYGGGVSLASGSIGSWTGKTAFLRNSVYYDYNGYVNGIVSSYGGALSVSSSSTLLLGGSTIFSRNTALSGNGGALFVGGNASLEGSVVFSDNVASNLGGAVCVTSSGSLISWSGNASFVNNIADTGGALVAASGSYVSWTAEINFTSNEARLDGGAVSLAPSSAEGSTTINSEEPFTTIKIAGRANFAYNKCGWSGGAIALSGMLSMSVNTSVVFRENSAEVYGGAIYISSIDVGPVFQRVQFESNIAQVGGAVYAAGSGTAVTKDVESNPVQYPSTFNNCSFVNNTAHATGGAVSSASGQDIFINTKFINNIARSGGALNLAGTASIINCFFGGNLAYSGGGPAVSNIGYLSDVSNSTFVDNILSCDEGSFLHVSQGEEDEAWEVACDGCLESCKDCNFGGTAFVPKCISLLEAGIEHASSDGGVATLEELVINEGYWRATSTSTKVLECYNSDACNGGVTGTADFCGESYSGAYCSVCRTNYAPSPNFVCTPCTSRKWGLVFVSIVCMVSLAGSIFVVLHLVSADMLGSGRGVVNRIVRRIPLQSLKIIIVVWQIVTQFSSVANVTFPDVYQRLLDTVVKLNFEITWVLSAGCMFSFDFHDKLLIATLGPIVCLSLLGITYNTAVARNRCFETALQNIRDKHVAMVLLITFLVYSNVSSIVFQMFGCEVLDDGKNYLRADYRIECNSTKHKALQVYAGFMVLLYPVGIPVLYATLLYRVRNVLDKATVRDVSPKAKSTSDLWKPYKPSRFYYELVECFRRILLTGAVVFIYPNSLAQIAGTLGVAFVFSMLSEALAPYDVGWDSWISRTGHVIVFMSMYVALIMKVEVSSEHTSSQRLLASVLVAAHICMVLMVAIEAVAMAFSVTLDETDGPKRKLAPCFPFRWRKESLPIHGMSSFDGIESSIYS